MHYKEFSSSLRFIFVPLFRMNLFFSIILVTSTLTHTISLLSTFENQVQKTPSPSDRAAEMLGKMTMDEKLLMLCGTTSPDGYVGFVPGNSRLNIPVRKTFLI